MISPSSAQATTLKPKSVATQKWIVHWKKSANPLAVLKSLRIDVIRLKRIDQWSILETAHSNDALLSQGLRWHPAVLGVFRDRMLIAAGTSSENRDLRACQDTNEPLDAASALREMIREIQKKSPKCTLFEACPQTGMTRLWAQIATDSDLMIQEASRLKSRVSDVKVAVLDTGFDLKGAGPLVSHPDRLHLYKGFPEALDPASDVAGHGTATTSMIVGKDGVGVSPEVQLNFYRLTKDDSGSASTEAILEATKKACADGNEIINLSWGDIVDEVGLATKEELEKQLFQDLANSGCLVVKSAGNKAIPWEVNTSDPDDSLLRVGASNVQGDRGWFSTRGEVTAPGENVFTYFSTQQKSSPIENDCAAKGGGFINGTSFSAPLTSGILSQVLGVLKTNPSFTQLPGPERIRVMNRVLQASQVNGVLNGLRAVWLADQLNQAGKEALASSTSDLQKLSQKRDARCEAEPAQCTDFKVSCESTRKCLDSIRLRSSLCAPPSKDDESILLEILTDSNSWDLSYTWLSRYPEPTESLKSHTFFAAWRTTAEEKLKDPKYTLRSKLHLYRAYTKETGLTLPDFEKASVDELHFQLDKLKANGAGLPFGVEPPSEEQKKLIGVAYESGILTPEVVSGWLKSDQYATVSVYTALTAGLNYASQKPPKLEGIFDALIEARVKGVPKSTTNFIFAGSVSKSRYLPERVGRYYQRLIQDSDSDGGVLSWVWSGLMSSYQPIPERSKLIDEIIRSKKMKSNDYNSLATQSLNVLNIHTEDGQTTLLEVLKNSSVDFERAEALIILATAKRPLSQLNKIMDAAVQQKKSNPNDPRFSSGEQTLSAILQYGGAWPERTQYFKRALQNPDISESLAVLPYFTKPQDLVRGIKLGVFGHAEAPAFLRKEEGVALLKILSEVETLNAESKELIRKAIEELQ